MEDIYLDNHTATCPDSGILDQMKILQKEYWPASSSPHRLGQKSQIPIQTAMAKLYDLIGCAQADGFYSSSNGAEAISQVFLSTYLTKVKETGRTHFIGTNLEEAPCLLYIKRMEKFGCSGKT